MSGIMRGKVDCFSNTGDTSTQNNEMFKGLYDFFASHPNMTLISRNSGMGASSGHIGYWESGTRFRWNAWAVFRLEPTVVRSYPVYVQIQYGEAGGNGFGGTATNPAANVGFGLMDGANIFGNSIAYWGIQCAIGEGGDQNPFRGTMNAGSPNDTRADPIWGIPTGGTNVHMFPRNNNPGGLPASAVTSKHDFAMLGHSETVGVGMRYHYIADDDSFVCLFDLNDDNTYHQTYCGLYVPRTGFTPTYPYVMIGSGTSSGGTPLPLSLLEYGNPANLTLGRRNGGVVAGATSNGVHDVFIDRFPTILSSTQQPNLQLVTPEYEEFPIPVYTNEATGGVTSIGHLGQLSFLKEAANLSTNDTNAALTRAAFGNSTLSSVKLMVPWGGVSPPKSASSRTGTTWTRARVASDD